MVVHAYNLSYTEGKDGRIVAQGQPEQRHETLSEKHTQSKRIGAWLKW
jgi:hypothetical protein